jgi:chondroitin AC lyase
MEKLDPEYSDKYVNANNYQNLSGNKHFWRSDFQVFRTPGFYFSVKMCSERVIGAESCNSENVQGYYMGDGATFLYQTAEEYRNIFPFWDWKKIPGTTVQQDNDTLPVLTARGYRIESNFVGGVSDGENGIAVMDYNRNGLTARKAWFMFNNKMVCLGAGIKSSEGNPVTTSVNQSFLNGEVIVINSGGEKQAGETEEIENPEWIMHDSTGYFFPDGGKLRLETKNMEGSWNRVASRYPDEILKADIFKLWFEHGINPKNKTYQYVLIPNTTPKEMEKMASNQLFKIRNEKDIQEVVAANGEIAGVVFYQPGKSEAFGGLEVDKPCVLMLKEINDGLQVSVADPTQLLSEINLVFHDSFSGENVEMINGKCRAKVLLPKGVEAGKTVTLKLLKIK